MSSQTNHLTTATQVSLDARTDAATIRLAAVALVVSGICFLLYPALRPFSDETTLAGAQAFGSTRWVVAHSLGIGAFTLLATGMLAAYLAFVRSAARRARWAHLLTVLGAGLTLPYYGAEVFGLHAVGRTSLQRGDADLFSTLTDAVRWGPGIWFIVTGLVLLAAAGILVASAAWASLTASARWAGVPLAVGLVLYLPQYTGDQWVRVVHGALMALGCALLAWSTTAPGRPASTPSKAG